MKTTVLTVVLSAVAVTTFGQVPRVQPFGLREGMSAEEVKKVVPDFAPAKHRYIWVAENMPGGDESRFESVHWLSSRRRPVYVSSACQGAS